MAAPTVQLKLEAQVMLLRNLELTGGASRMLVNGSRGVVCNFLPAAEVKARIRGELNQVRCGGSRLAAVHA